MTIDQLIMLLSSLGQTALTAAMELSPTDATFLACYEKLRKQFDADLAKIAVEMAILRVKAAAKHPDAAVMYFTKEALEQSTSEIVASHRAKRFVPYKTVLDLGCGIGGDAIALARAGCRVIAFDNDPVRAKMAEINLQALGLRGEVRVADLMTVSIPDADAIFCDPTRRAGDRRYLGISDYIPDPRLIVKRFASKTPIAFKLAPGVPWDDLEEFDGEVDFVSLNGELKECTLWLGPFKTTAHRATLLPAGDTLTAEESQPEPEVGELGDYLYDPDPAVERAKLIGDLAAMLNAVSIDAAPAYLTANAYVGTPFAVAYKVIASMKYDRKKLNAVLRSNHIGRVTIHRKNSPENAEAVQKGLKLEGDAHGHLMLTRIEGMSCAILTVTV